MTRVALAALAAVAALHGQAPFAASPPSVDVSVPQGLPASIDVGITSAGTNGPLGFTIKPQFSGIGGWMSVSPGSGVTPQTVRVAFLTGGLGPGDYTASILVTATTTTSFLTIPVTMKLLGSGTPSGSGLKVDPGQLQFSAQAGSPLPQSQTLSITSETPTPLNIQTTYQTGANWLTVSPPVASTPATLTIAANPTGLTGGDYLASIAISSLQTGTVTVPVTLSVLPYVLKTTPQSFDFTYLTTDPAPAAQTLSLASTGAAVDFTVNQAAASWLTVSPRSGKTPASVSLTVNPAGLTPGKYGAVLDILSPTAAGGVQHLAVSLTVTQKGVLAVTPSLMNFSVPADGSFPAAQTIVVDTGGGAPFPFTATVSGGSWLSVTPASATAPRNLTVLANPLGLAPGSYSGKVTLSAAGISGSPLDVRVNFTITPLGPVVDAVTNAATLTQAAVAPGEIVTLFGKLMGPDTLVGAQQSAPGFLDKILGGVTVAFDGVPSALIYVRSDQLSAVVPYSVAGKVNTQVVVLYKGQASRPVSVPVTDSVPGIFTVAASGKGPGAILDSEYHLISASNPATRGSIVLIFATGEGQTNPAGTDGKLADAPFPAPVLGVSVTIGGRDAKVLYAGAAPGNVAGLMQINAEVPPDTAPGDSVPVVVTVGRNASPSGVTMSVR